MPEFCCVRECHHFASECKLRRFPNPKHKFITNWENILEGHDREYRRKSSHKVCLVSICLYYINILLQTLFNTVYVCTVHIYVVHIHIIRTYVHNRVFSCTICLNYVYTVVKSNGI